MHSKVNSLVVLNILKELKFSLENLKFPHLRDIEINFLLHCDVDSWKTSIKYLNFAGSIIVAPSGSGSEATACVCFFSDLAPPCFGPFAFSFANIFSTLF